MKGGQLFKSSVLRSNDMMEATFNIKDFAVIVALCKAMHADVMLHMGSPGTPLLVEAANIGAGNGMDAVDAELLLATVAEFVQVRSNCTSNPLKFHQLLDKCQERCRVHKLVYSRCASMEALPAFVHVAPESSSY